LLLLLVAAGYPFGCGPTTDSPPGDTPTGPDAPFGQQTQAVGGVPTGPLSSNRLELKLVLLPDGRALAVGGAGDQSCEVYNPATGTWSLTGAMLQPHGTPAAVLLQDGRVLVAGGNSNRAELYDPATGTWSLTGDMPVSFAVTHAAVLPDGRVLVVGEQTQVTAFFHPATGTWSPAPSRPTSSRGVSMTSLLDGRVVVVGGSHAELFDPATSTWTPSEPSTLADRRYHAIMTLADGRVLVTGGYTAVGTHLATAAIYDPATHTFSETGSLSGPRFSHIMMRLPDGKVRVFGGGSSRALDTVEQFDPATGTFTPKAKMATPRAGHKAVWLGDGRLLIAGGTSHNSEGHTAELYDPADCYTSCAWLNKNCGSLPDGCGGTLECGPCGGGLTCNANVCGDITAPVAAFTAPRTDIVLSNTVTVSVTATDAVGAVRAELSADSRLVGVLEGPGPYSWNWSTRDTSSDTSRLTVRVYDAAGNVGSATRDVRVSNGYLYYASYDTTYRVPRCAYPSSTCTSDLLLFGRATLGAEPHQPNTLHAACPDGTAGTFYVDESLNVLSVSTLDYSPLAEGKLVRVEATVWASASWMSDALELYSTADVAAPGGPTWNLLATLHPSRPGSNVLSTTFVLPAGGTQAIRGLFYRGPSASLCSPTGSYDDRDDLMFAVLNHPDPDAPTVSLTAPSEGTTLARTVTLQASASDNFGVSRVEFYMDGQLLGSDTTAPFTYPWDTQPLENGSHTLTARAYDVKGNAATSAPVQVQLSNDKVPPAITVLSPASGATVSGSVEVQVTASDNEAVVEVRLLVDGQLTSSDSHGPITSAALPWNTRAHGNGSHTLTVTATDLSGNTTTSAAVQVTVDNDVVAPAVSLTAPVSGATLTGTVTLAADVSDGVGVTRVEYYAGTTWLAASTVAPFQVSFDSSPLVNGSHTLTARAFDAAGNVGTSAGIPVSVANAGSPGHAAYDDLLQVPACGSPGISCDSVGLLDGRAWLGPELHAPNTLYSECFDGTSGGYHWSQSLDRLKVSSVDGSPLTEGKPVRIDATVWAVSPENDRLDLFYTEDVSYPTWRFLGTLTPTANGQQTLSKTYVLPRGSRQAVRGVFRPGGDIQLCAYGSRTDGDDLVFAAVREPDLVAPTVSLTEPVNGATLSGIATFTASATDNFGVQQVDFYANGRFIGASTEAPFTMSVYTVSWNNGSYTLTAVASDVAGNTAHSEPVQVTVNNDKLAPTVSLTSPTDGSTVSGTVSVAATASDNVGVSYVEYRVDGTFVGSDFTAPYEYTWNTSTWANGAHTLSARARDAAGNQSVISSVQLTVNNDKTPPTVSLTAPAPGAIVSGAVTLTATASDNVGVTRVEFYVDGALLGSSTTAPYAYSWNSSALADGSHTLTAKAYDAVNLVTTSVGVTVTVRNDMTAPTVALTAPAPGATLTGTVTLTATASDNVGVTRVEFYADGALLGSDTTAPYAYSWNSGALTNGSHTLSARAYDGVGNVGTSAGVQVTLNNDRTAPTVSLTAPAPNATVNGTVLLTATASDNVGVTRVEFYVGNSLLGSVAAAPYQFSWNTNTLPNCIVTLQARAYDAAGNVALSSSASVMVARGDNVFTYSRSDTNSAQVNTANHTLTLTQGETLTLGTCGVSGSASSGDTYLRLYGPSGSLVTANDNGCGVGAGSQFTYTVPAGGGGSYQLRAGCYANTSCSGIVAWTRSSVIASGTLTYSASNTNSAQANTVNRTLALVQGQKLILGTCGVTGASFAGDTYLRLYGPSGSQVAENDDACGGVGSNFTYTVPAGAGGNYQLRAGCFSSNSCNGTVAWTIQ
jgi:hypothetical protein